MTKAKDEFNKLIQQELSKENKIEKDNQVVVKNLQNKLTQEQAHEADVEKGYNKEVK
jgi:hypothetical protein